MFKKRFDNDVKDFYSRLKFPGQYTIDHIREYASEIVNPYLQIIDKHLKNDINIADIGCGSGYICNLFATRYTSKLYALDFSDAIDFAKNFADKHRIHNISFAKKDLFDIDQDTIYDVVICQGVLHHIPEYKKAVKIIKKITGKKLILSVYHPSGKFLKKFISIDYRSNILKADQEDVPYETSFSKNKILSMFHEFKLIECYPAFPTLNFLCNPISHSRNGGLVTYVLEKQS